MRKTLFAALVALLFAGPILLIVCSDLLAGDARRPPHDGGVVIYGASR